MSPPIYTPDGNEVSEIVLPDGSTASQVIGPDGNVVFEAEPDIPDSAVLFWDFEQDYTDSWNNNDGTKNGDPQFVTNSQNGTYALDLDGSGDYVDINPLNTTISGAKSFAIWINHAEDGQSRIFESATNENALLDNDTGSSYAGVPDGSVGFIVDTSHDPVYATHRHGNWVHWCVTHNPSNSDLSLYKDGSQVDSRSVGAEQDVSKWMVGFSFGGSYYVDGIVDDMRVYDKELSSSEVSNLYSSGSITG